jgi:hypothetical protein
MDRFKPNQSALRERGILYSALDEHTRLGEMFLKFAREVEAVASYFRHHPLPEPVTVLGVAVFIEGPA